MKRICNFLTVLLIVLLLTACGGNIRHVVPVIGPSDLYEEAEIEEAMDIVLSYFQKEFGGCTLTRLEYDETRVRDVQLGWAEQYGEEQALVLLSDFDVDESGGDGSLNPGDTYRNWQWVLTRTDGGTWVLRTWGYG